MSIQKIRNILNESLFGSEKPKVGFMEYDYSGVEFEQFDDFFEEIRKQLKQVSVDTKNMRNVKEQKRIIIVTTQDKAAAVQDIFAYYEVPCVKSIFDTQSPDVKAQNNYPEPSDVQNTGQTKF